MKKALAERVLQEVVVSDLDEVDEHGALALALVRDQHSEERKFWVNHHDFSMTFQVQEYFGTPI